MTGANTIQAMNNQPKLRKLGHRSQIQDKTHPNIKQNTENPSQVYYIFKYIPFVLLPYTSSGSWEKWSHLNNFLYNSKYGIMADLGKKGIIVFRMTLKISLKSHYYFSFNTPKQWQIHFIEHYNVQQAILLTIEHLGIIQLYTV